MADPEVTDLLRRSQFVFEGSVAGVGRSTVASVPPDDHTVVMTVGRVLHAPAAIARSAGSDVTVQLLPGSPRLALGDSAVLFTTAVAFAEGIVVAEVGRTSVGLAGDTTMAAGTAATRSGARSGRAHPVLAAAQEMADEDLRRHADEAAAVVVGRVVSVAKAGPLSTSEHDPDWWKATIKVDSTARGDAKGRIAVLYPNSYDVHWASVPKPQAGQEGMWVLHATPPERVALAPFSLLDNDDFHAADHVERLSGDDR